MPDRNCNTISITSRTKIWHSMPRFCSRRLRRFCLERERNVRQTSVCRKFRNRSRASDKIKFVGHFRRGEVMKKLFTQTIVFALATMITAGALAQSPSATRQRRTTASAATNSDDATGQKSTAKLDDKTKSASSAVDPAANRANQSSDEDQIVQNYNNFLKTYKLYTADEISIMIF